MLLGLEEGQEMSCREHELLCYGEVHLAVPTPLLAVDLLVLNETFG